MVIKGSARGGAAALAAHLQRTDTNEVAELREVRGLVAEDLDGALREIEAVASGARSKRPFYHASINTRADELMTPEQWTKAIDRLEQELDLTGQPRAVVAHVKEGRAHVHVAWSRIELETMKAIADSHNYRRHEIVARELEREFGHARVQGAHVEREGEARPERTPSHAEMQQAERTGIAPGEAKAQLTEIWNRTDSGQAFAAAIQEQGWMLARGDKRDFVVLDVAGEVHSLGRRIQGAKAKDVRARMSDLDAENLPSVEDARAAQRRQLQQIPESVAPIEPEPPQMVPPDHQRETQVGGAGQHQVEVQPGGKCQSADEEERREHRDDPATATTDASMVAQQREALRRFEENSAELESLRQERLGLLDAAIDQATDRDRHVHADADRARQRDDLER